MDFASKAKKETTGQGSELIVTKKEEKKKERKKRMVAERVDGGGIWPASFSNSGRILALASNTRHKLTGRL